MCNILLKRSQKHLSNGIWEPPWEGGDGNASPKGSIGDEIFFAEERRSLISLRTLCIGPIKRKFSYTIAWVLKRTRIERKVSKAI